MKRYFDFVIYIFCRTLIYILKFVPYRLKCHFFNFILQILVTIKPDYKEIATKNILQAFPEKTAEEVNLLFKQYLLTLGSTLADFTLLPYIDSDWIERNVSFVNQREVGPLLESNTRPILLAGGHLGSFELLPAVVAHFIEPISYVVRSFKNSYMDHWWNQVRNQHGNITIPRKGAFKSILKCLISGRPLGLLFDQNVVRNNAIFVDFFGRPAATTAALGISAVRTKALILIPSLKTVTEQCYEFKIVVCDFDSIYNDTNLSKEDKAHAVTQAVTKAFEELVCENPAEWLWLHRRWKTLPEDSELPHFYQSSVMQN